MFHLFDRRARTASAHYPKIPFHALRAGQLLSSLVVGAITSFFVYHVKHDHWDVPWTFIWLMSASLFSVAALAFTILLHWRTGLHPHLNLIINSFLAFLWALSWTPLAWYARDTITGSCEAIDADEDPSAKSMVCRIYKALFAFALLGLVSTIAALLLDLHVWRQSSHRGMYRLQDTDSKPLRSNASRGAFTDDYDDEDFGESHVPGRTRDSEAWEEPRPYEMRNMSSEFTTSGSKSGYAGVSDGNFEDDTGYRPTPRRDL